MRRQILGLLLVAAAVLGPAPATAHEADPRIVTTLDRVQPALPADVVVQVQAGIATQLVARNPTPTVLEVVGSDGRPFLRISRAGVEADVAAREFFTTSSPTGAAPSRSDGAQPRWVRVSDGDSWGWYDHRLHPEQLRAPEDPEREARLGEWEVPLRYGDAPVTVGGAVAFRPLLGSLQVTADPAPAGLTVQALPGRLPGLFLSAQPGVEVTVLGRDGEPFLRIADTGVEVNQSSRTHVEDRAARGQAAGPPSPTPDFRLVAAGARTYTWLDARLRYPAELPPDEVLRADGPTVLERWRVPVELDGRSLALTGEISWVPEAAAAARVGGVVDAPDDGSVVPYAVGGAGVLVLAGAVLGLRRRRDAQRRG